MFTNLSWLAAVCLASVSLEASSPVRAYSYSSSSIIILTLNDTVIPQLLYSSSCTLQLYKEYKRSDIITTYIIFLARAGI